MKSESMIVMMFIVGLLFLACLSWVEKGERHIPHVPTGWMIIYPPDIGYEDNYREG
jgi:hypothetical protein